MATCNTTEHIFCNGNHFKNVQKSDVIKRGGGYQYRSWRKFFDFFCHNADGKLYQSFGLLTKFDSNQYVCMSVCLLDRTFYLEKYFQRYTRFTFLWMPKHLKDFKHFGVLLRKVKNLPFFLGGGGTMIYPNELI